MNTNNSKEFTKKNQRLIGRKKEGKKEQDCFSPFSSNISIKNTTEQNITQSDHNNSIQRRKEQKH